MTTVKAKKTRRAPKATVHTRRRDASTPRQRLAPELEALARGEQERLRPGRRGQPLPPPAPVTPTLVALVPDREARQVCAARVAALQALVQAAFDAAQGASEAGATPFLPVLQVPAAPSASTCVLPPALQAALQQAGALELWRCRHLVDLAALMQASLPEAQWQWLEPRLPSAVSPVSGLNERLRATWYRSEAVLLPAGGQVVLEMGAEGPQL
ncbi:MAG: hypothetical protein ACPGUV_09605, partial [Polyangiales bacterium]